MLTQAGKDINLFSSVQLAHHQISFSSSSITFLLQLLWFSRLVKCTMIMSWSNKQTHVQLLIFIGVSWDSLWRMLQQHAFDWLGWHHTTPKDQILGLIVWFTDWLGGNIIMYVTRCNDSAVNEKKRRADTCQAGVSKGQKSELSSELLFAAGFICHGARPAPFSNCIHSSSQHYLCPVEDTFGWLGSEDFCLELHLVK